MLDYFVVGLGISGVAVSAHLDENDLRFMVIADGRRMASTVAGGVYNPVVLKRLNPTWKGTEFLDYALPFYRGLEQLLDQQFVFEKPILRRFSNAEEQNNWYAAADQPILNRFLSAHVQPNTNDSVIAPLGLGEVKETGRLDVPGLLDSYAEYLKKTDRLLEEELDFDLLSVEKDAIRYKEFKARRMILVMGHRALESPFFGYLPIRGNKGEVLVIEAQDLKLRTILKGSDFVIPLGNDRYKVGATYDPTDISFAPTEKARSRLIRNLESLISCSYTILNHEVGIRPTIPDRRPILGVHPEFLNIAILNGMGSRGVLLAPKMALHLVEHLEEGKALWPETDVDRFREYYEDARDNPASGL